MECLNTIKHVCDSTCFELLTYYVKCDAYYGSTYHSTNHSQSNWCMSVLHVTDNFVLNLIRYFFFANCAMAAFKQWGSSGVPWWGGHWIPRDNIWEAIYIADKCLHQRKWGWENYRERDEVSFVVWSNTRFPSLCNSLEPYGDYVSSIINIKNPILLWQL